MRSRQRRITRQRSKSKQAKPADTILGLPFYTPEEFEKQMQYADDDPDYETYRDWLKAHRELKRKLERLGVSVVEVPIDVDEMQRFFFERGLKNDAANRSQYVARKLFENRSANKPS